MIGVGLLAIYWACMVYLLANLVATLYGLSRSRRARREAEERRWATSRLNAELLEIINAQKEGPWAKSLRD